VPLVAACIEAGTRLRPICIPLGNRGTKEDTGPYHQEEAVAKRNACAMACSDLIGSQDIRLRLPQKSLVLRFPNSVTYSGESPTRY
jgi:hypothetical protein